MFLIKKIEDLPKGISEWSKSCMLHLIDMHQYCILIHMDFDVILGMRGEPLDGKVVLSAGTAVPRGCRERFEAMPKNAGLSVVISTGLLAEYPLNTTAKGALIMAITETG